MPAARDVTELIGVYHADGGAVGEARYLIGKLLGTAHCALCDVTHSPVRKKPEWDRTVARLGIPFTMLHLNELPRDVSEAVASAGSPVVLARTDDGTLATVLDRTALEGMQGSVSNFEGALRASLGSLPGE